MLARDLRPRSHHVWTPMGWGRVQAVMCLAPRARVAGGGPTNTFDGSVEVTVEGGWSRKYGWNEGVATADIPA